MQQLLLPLLWRARVTIRRSLLWTTTTGCTTMMGLARGREGALRRQRSAPAGQRVLVLGRSCCESRRMRKRLTSMTYEEEEWPLI